MSKAYNKVEWNFLSEMMLRLGFSNQWIQLMMKCIAYVSYSVLVNGYIIDSFVPKRGLRQKDPLFSYLFPIYLEGLSTLLSKCQRDGLIKGIATRRHGPRVNHYSLLMIAFFLQMQIEVKRRWCWTCCSPKKN